MYRFYFATSAVMLAILVAALVMKSDVAGPALLVFLITLVLAALQYGVDTLNLSTCVRYAANPVAVQVEPGHCDHRHYDMAAIDAEPTYWIQVGLADYQVSKPVSWLVGEIVATLATR
jgi:hypothetical protein